jgi:hypothetical protein
MEVVVGKNRDTTINLDLSRIKYVKEVVNKALTMGLNGVGVSGPTFGGESRPL